MKIDHPDQLDLDLPAPAAPHRWAGIQLGLDLTEDEPEYRFTALIDENFEAAAESEKPFLSLAAALLEATAEDLKTGLTLCRSAFDSGEMLDYSACSRPLNHMLDALDWLNESDEGGVNLPETAAQLQLNPISLRLFIAGVHRLDVGPAPRHLLRLPPVFFSTLEQLQGAPAKRANPPPATPVPVRRVHAPQASAQPALWAVCAAWAKLSLRQAARGDK